MKRISILLSDNIVGVFIGGTIAVLLILWWILKRLNKTSKTPFVLITAILCLFITGCKSTKNNEDTVMKNNNSIANIPKSDEWQSFKKFWQKLDAIKYVKSTEDDVLMIGPARDIGDISTDEKNSLHDELDFNLTNSLIKLQEQGVINELEKDILSSICRARLEHLCYNMSTRIMVSHMIVPATEPYKDTAIHYFEQRIDTLTKLREQGKIDDTDLEQTIAQIWKSIEAYLILNEISRGFPYALNLPGVGMDISKSESIMKNFNEYISNQLETQKKIPNTDYYNKTKKLYDKTLKTIDEIKKISPHLKIIITELER